MSKKVMIVGAGAAGLVSAIKAAGEGASVTVLEKNDVPGKKLLSTGNGRCNLTNLDQALSHYRGSEPLFAAGALKRFSMQDTVKFFSDLGIYTVNQDGRLYPRSGQASQVRDLLVMDARSKGVKIRCRTGVKSIKKSAGGGFDVNVEGYSYHCDSLILANGSPASAEVPENSGYALAESFGHHIVPVLPALVPIITKEKYNWQGVRTEGFVSLLIDGRRSEGAKGELQLTSYGISGIPVLEISRFASRALHEGREVQAVIDFFPDYDREGLTHLLKIRSELCPYKNKEELLAGLFPDKLIKVLCRFEDTASAIKDFSLNVTGTKGLGQAQVCSGGIDTREVDPFTMESMLCPGLYFAGEILDIDGTCGGYNLQWAWSSGAAAGKCAAI